MLRITPASSQRDVEPVLAWHRVHGIDPMDCAETRVFPLLRIAAFRMLNQNADGRRCVVRDWLTGELRVSESWWLRRLRLPPALEWCEKKTG